MAQVAQGAPLVSGMDVEADRPQLLSVKDLGQEVFPGILVNVVTPGIKFKLHSTLYQGGIYKHIIESCLGTRRV